MQYKPNHSNAKSGNNRNGDISDNRKVKNLVEGTVVEALPNTQFKVTIDKTNEEIRAYLGGRMKQNRIKVFVGDRVSILMDQYGESHRIERRA